MKHKILLKLIFVLALAFVFSSHVNASEVTGSLSSGISGGGNQNDTDTEGPISGTVVSESARRGSNSSSTSSTGTVRSATSSNDDNVNSGQTDSLSSNNNISPNFGDFGSGLVLGDSTSNSSYDNVAQDSVPVLDLSASTAGISVGNWIWIILLSLLLLATITYMYVRNQDRSGKISF